MTAANTPDGESQDRVQAAATEHDVCGPDCTCGCEAGRTISIPRVSRIDTRYHDGTPGSFHGQWMTARSEVSELRGVPLSAKYDLLKRLAKARELIEEENEPRVRRCGGQIIREVRQECRWLQRRQDD